MPSPSLSRFLRPAALSALFCLAPGIGAHAAVKWNAALRQPAKWYATAEARSLADSVLQYQTPDGGWPKNTDFSDPPDEEFLEDTRMDHRAATIDNNATTTPLRFLAKVVSAKGGDARDRAAFERGFDYLLAAQYENGGWPQYFPLKNGYYTHITYNDGAMVNVLTLLTEAAAGREPYAFLDAKRRALASSAVAKGVACILRTQVKQNGKLTAWCAQHDEKTFAPAWARNFEPPSLSGGESVGIVRYLMSIEKPSREVIASVEGAAAWFEKTKITGLRYETFTAEDGKKDRRVVPDHSPTTPPLWARFYELGTDRPIFIGRDKVVHYVFAEIERERRAGYGYYGSAAESLLKTDYPAWRKRLGLPPVQPVPSSSSSNTKPAIPRKA